MSSLAQLPEPVISVLHENAEALWAWVSGQHYAQVVAQAGPAALLVQVKMRFDFHAIEQACAWYHVYAGQQGQAPTHTIGQLCRAPKGRPIIAALVRYNQARHARSIGLAKADFQVRLAATAYNLKKWHKLSLDKAKAARTKPPDSA